MFRVVTQQVTQLETINPQQAFGCWSRVPYVGQ
jgi:hypothetical protein